MRADNFTDSDLPELMLFLHRHGVKGFVAFNTLVFADELEAAIKQIEEIARAGVDAVIVQDLGVAKLVQEIAPEMEIHASTQMTITSAEGLEFVHGFLDLDRAVLAREMSVDDIRRVQEEGEVPLEVFVHGALCVAYSGQCLTSESLGQRSANRGECAQACRLPYELVVDGQTRPMGDVRYLLSPQDLAAVDVIPQLVKAGVMSFKIEGRLKSPEYVAAVTRVYRKALDEVTITQEDRYALEMMFSRGLSTGWLEGTNHPRLTHGKWAKKRGAFVGVISNVGEGWIELNEQELAVKIGDGFVFDAGEDRNKEQGGSVWKVEAKRLFFDRRCQIDWRKVQPGQGIWKTSDPTLQKEIKQTWKAKRLEQKGEKLIIKVTGTVGEALCLESRGKSVKSEVLLEKAVQHALSTEILEAQLSRLGGTRYQLDRVDNQVQGQVMIPLGELNRLRRRLVSDLAVQRVVHSGTEALSRLLPKPVELNQSLPHLRVLCRSFDQLEGAIRGGAQMIYCDFEDLREYREAVKQARAEDVPIYLATPRIQKPKETAFFKMIEKAEPDGVLVRNLGAVQYFHERGIARVADFSLNVANPVTARLLMQHGGFQNLTISYDLNEKQVVDLAGSCPQDWFELTLHQHMPMFHMEHCVFCTFLSEGTSIKNCGKPCERHQVELRDRVGQLHILKADVGCRNTLFNGRAQTGAGSVDELVAAGLRVFRVELLEEDKRQAERLVRWYREFLLGKGEAHELVRKIGAIERLGVTKGTLEQRREEVHRSSMSL